MARPQAFGDSASPERPKVPPSDQQGQEPPPLDRTDEPDRGRHAVDRSRPNSFVRKSR